jgi:hypothetical protein
LPENYRVPDVQLGFLAGVRDIPIEGARSRPKEELWKARKRS